MSSEQRGNQGTTSEGGPADTIAKVDELIKLGRAAEAEPLCTQAFDTAVGKSQGEADSKALVGIASRVVEVARLLCASGEQVRRRHRGRCPAGGDPERRVGGDGVGSWGVGMRAGARL